METSPWVVLEYAINGTPMAVILTKEETGFVADIVRATDVTTLRAYLAGETDPDAVERVPAVGEVADLLPIGRYRRAHRRSS